MREGSGLGAGELKHLEMGCGDNGVVPIWIE